MVKNANRRYRFGNRSLSLKKLYQVTTPVAAGKKGILRSIRVQMTPNIPVLIVFVRPRAKKNEWSAILSTDCELLKLKSYIFTASVGILKSFSNALNHCCDWRKNFKAVPTIC